MSPEARYVLTVTVGVAAFVLGFALEAPGTVVVANGLVYAAAGYLTSGHPGLLWGRRTEQESVVAAAAYAAGMLGLLGAGVSSGTVVLVLGLIYVGFAGGVSYAQEAA